MDDKPPTITKAPDEGSGALALPTENFVPAPPIPPELEDEAQAYCRFVIFLNEHSQQDTIVTTMTPEEFAAYRQEEDDE